MVIAPGKLVLAGEYGVLVPEGLGLVLAVGPGITARARRPRMEPLSKGSVETPAPITLRLHHTDTPIQGHWNGRILKLETHHPGTRFAVAALETLAQEVGDIAIDLELTEAGWAGLAPTPAGLKPGFGGSAAATVATITAIAHALEMHLSRGDLLQLSHRAHRRAQRGLGSGIDIAASVYGGLLRVQAPPRPRPPTRHPRAQDLHLDRFGPLRTTEPPKTTPVPWPPGWEILVVWSGKSVGTASRAAWVQGVFAAEPTWADSWCKRSDTLVEEATDAIRRVSWYSFSKAMGACREHLLSLGDFMGMPMEDDSLKALHDIASRFGTCKQSGAGGGDSAIVLARTPRDRDKAQTELEKHGFVTIPLELASPGPVL